MKCMKFIKPIYLFLIATALISCNDNENSEIKTSEINSITPYSAIGSGDITSMGAFPILERGICWSSEPNPTYSRNHSSDSIGIGKYSSKILNLNADSTYYARAYFINKVDTIYGNQVKFTTPNAIIFNNNATYGSVNDVDGNVYKTVKIGTQTWMAENLKVTHFQNGDEIKNETDLGKWGYFQIKTSAYCWLKNDAKNKNIYGACYNWYAASDSRNIAPAGWHVASAKDWDTLNKYLNPYSNLYNHTGNMLRESTTAHWKSMNEFSPITNELGFTAIPSGQLAISSFSFMDYGYRAYYWTSDGTLDGSSCVYLDSELLIANLRPNCIGYSIRCVKD